MLPAQLIPQPWHGIGEVLCWIRTTLSSTPVQKSKHVAEDDDLLLLQLFPVLYKLFFCRGEPFLVGYVT